MPFLPVSREECRTLGWDAIDFLFVTPDAYVDHPSFGAALLSRLLEAEGYRVGIAAQPDPDHPESLEVMGRPRLGVLVSGGIVDSMVDNYTAARRPRSRDRYSPGGIKGRRPDRVTIHYCNMVRDCFGDIPLVIGGIEASLRRFAHYDYWDHAVRRSILQDSRADILVYGMGELPLLSIASLLAKGVAVSNIQNLPGTCVMVSEKKMPEKWRTFLAEAATEGDSGDGPIAPPFPEDDKHVLLPSFDCVKSDPRAYAEAFRVQYLEQVPVRGRTLLQRHGVRYVVQNPPTRPLRQKELDRLYALPYE
ncbi:MAG: YgiQ family radical SAM protein, partial [Clostridiaceae bacterium]|nr:YgiQ family radical SAM protein [Clostridiaceae bacterium]